jgi:hypothetical protein
MAILRGSEINVASRRRLLSVWGAICLFALGLLALSARGQERTASKDEVKAAFLFNFAKFVEWPSDSLSGSNAPIRIGVLGRNDPFIATLEKTVYGKKIDEHPVVVEIYEEIPGEPPHILFISPTERRPFRRALAQVNGKPVLTASEAEGFPESGGVINFKMEGRKMRFEINPKAAERNRLKLSSKLLGVAMRLVETEAEQ